MCVGALVGMRVDALGVRVWPWHDGRARGYFVRGMTGRMCARACEAGWGARGRLGACGRGRLGAGRNRRVGFAFYMYSACVLLRVGAHCSGF
jgi:hypothetical protein